MTGIEWTAEVQRGLTKVFCEEGGLEAEHAGFLEDIKANQYKDRRDNIVGAWPAGMDRLLYA